MSAAKEYRVLAINPGSTSTKIALFEGSQKLFGSEVAHEAAELRKCAEIADQFPLRRDTVIRAMAEAGLPLDGVGNGGIDAYAGRGGGLTGCAGGTYAVNDIMLSDARSGRYAKHPASFGSILASDFAREFGGRAFVVNPPTVDEMDDVARITG
ncbi:MAG: butyrate kinase, partial [Treponemataceae bacterium]